MCAGKAAAGGGLFPACVAALGPKCSHLCTAVKVALASGKLVLDSLQVRPAWLLICFLLLLLHLPAFCYLTCTAIERASVMRFDMRTHSF